MNAKIGIIKKIIGKTIKVTDLEDNSEALIKFSNINFIPRTKYMLNTNHTVYVVYDADTNELLSPVTKSKLESRFYFHSGKVNLDEWNVEYLAESDYQILGTVSQNTKTRRHTFDETTNIISILNMLYKTV